MSCVAAPSWCPTGSLGVKHSLQRSPCRLPIRQLHLSADASRGESPLSSAARGLLEELGARRGHCQWSPCEQAHQTDQDTEVSIMSTTPCISSPWNLASLGEETLSSLGWLWAETTLDEMPPSWDSLPPSRAKAKFSSLQRAFRISRFS